MPVADGFTTEGSGAAFVRRERLTSRLVASRDTPVVLIDAPAGFGKTTVLGEWAAVDDRPFASVRLTERHDDPALLTDSIADAVSEFTPIDDAVRAALLGSRTGVRKVAVARLLESLEHADTELVLALDDVHTITDDESLGVVGAIADGLPRGSQLAVAARGEPPIRLGRKRANRELTELGASDLAFTHAEAVTLLRRCGLELGPHSVKRLVDRTEGWPAALHLATVSLSSTDDVDRAAAEFAGDDRLIADYLRDELLSAIDPEQLSFLIRTSILEELTGELCDAVLATSGSAGTLRDLARSNALVIRLDDKDRRFRYHALLRQMLAAELHRLRPGEAAALHVRASEWYRARGDFDHAVPHASESGNVTYAADLVWSVTADYAGGGRGATLERWLDQFNAPDVEGSVPLSLARATCVLNSGDGAAVDHWCAHALELLKDARIEGGRELAITAGAIRASGSARDGIVKAREDVVSAYEELPEDSPWRSMCRLIEGVSHHLAGDPVRARAALEDAIRRASVDVPDIHAISLSQLALVELDAKDQGAADVFVDQALGLTELYALTEQPTAALVFAVGALVKARAGESSVAHTHASCAIRLLGELHEFSPWYETEARIAIARALVALDDVAGARAQLAEAGRHRRLTPDAPILREWLELAWREADVATVADRWPLTPAELRLLHQLPTHLSFREIADELSLSTNTVKTQARSIYGKLGVSSRAEAVTCARTAGLLDSNASPPGRRADLRST